MQELNNLPTPFGTNFNAMTTSLLVVQHKNIVIAPGEPRFITLDDDTTYITTDDGTFITTDS